LRVEERRGNASRHLAENVLFEIDRAEPRTLLLKVFLETFGAPCERYEVGTATLGATTLLGRLRDAILLKLVSGFRGIASIWDELLRPPRKAAAAIRARDFRRKIPASKFRARPLGVYPSPGAA
jgi:hypothetical protein